MNKKAFTLVELMGVITILGLISLLIAPTIVNQIRNSKDKIDEVTLKLIYSATDLYLDSKENEYPKNKGSIYCLKLGDLVDNGKLSSPVLNSNGDEISLDRIIAVNVTNNNYNYSMPSSCEYNQTYQNGVMVSTNSCIEEGKCEPGTEVSVDVNYTDTYNFYVLNDDSSEITLIMDRNLGDRVVWASKADYNDDTNYGTNGNNNKGPITALNYLNNQTADWTNIDVIESYTYNNNLNGTTNTSGYQKLEIKNGKATLKNQDGSETNELEGVSRARLLTYEEVEDSKLTNSGAIATYLYGNLSSSNTIESPYGHWLLTTSPELSRYTRVMYYGGTGLDSVDFDGPYGVRPVITLKK